MMAMEKKGKILIVDDNEDVLLSLNMLLKPYVEGIRVINTPERIIGMMDSFRPDVIMLDMNFHRDAISGEEGYEWLKKILAHNPKSVVLFITAYVDTEKAVRAIKAGAIDFIPKPWDRNKLLDTVKSAVQNEYNNSTKKGSGDMSITATELKNNLGKYLLLSAKEDVFITKNGKVVAKLTNPHQDRVEVAKSLFGILPKDADLNEAKEERLGAK